MMNKNKYIENILNDCRSNIVTKVALLYTQRGIKWQIPDDLSADW